MKPSWAGFKANHPFRRSPPWKSHSSYAVVDAAVLLLWTVRLFSPGSWWAAVFSYRAKNGRYYPLSHAMELYLFGVFVFSIIVGATQILSGSPTIATVICIIFLVEIVHYHIWIMIIRPRIDETYIQYNSARTVILTFVAYINIVCLYSGLYYHALGDRFDPPLTPWVSLAYSAGEITGSGYGAVYPDRSLALALTAASEKLVGVLFLALIIAISITKFSAPEIGRNKRDYVNEDPPTAPPS